MQQQWDSDHEIIAQSIAWYTSGYRVALVTVACTWGSSPRPSGSLMVMREDGVHKGSVSGGCVEEDLLARYRDGQLAESYPTIIDYGVDRQQATRFGLPCGGRLELLIEKIDDSTQLQLLLNKIEKGELVRRRVCLNTGEVSLHAAGPEHEFSYDAAHLQKVFGPQWQLLLIGAGQLSQYVAQLALLLNYRVTVCEPRDEYVQQWELANVTLTRDMPDEVVEEISAHNRAMVLALTHDPKLDDMALMQALLGNFFYVGALGSHKNSRLRRERLLKLGISPQQLDKLHAPVGLAIGSHTPAEIAIAIIAEITAARNNALAQANQQLLSA